MKYDPHYYIQKIGDSIDSLPYVEVTVDNTKIIVVNIRAGRELIYKVYFTNFSKEISGWYHDISIIKIKAKGEYRHLHFITCYQSKEKTKKLLS